MKLSNGYEYELGAECSCKSIKFVASGKEKLNEDERILCKKLNVYENENVGMLIKAIEPTLKIHDFLNPIA